jgi:nucleotide-binding universal stress UspA family protein
VAVLGPPDRVAVATVTEPADPTLVIGTGIAAGVMSEPDFEGLQNEIDAEARSVLERTCTALGLPDAERFVLLGSPGSSLCELAGSLPASVVVAGTRGHGGLRRAVLGSVSDYLVRNAPCPVLTTGER